MHKTENEDNNTNDKNKNNNNFNNINDKKIINIFLIMIKIMIVTTRM